MSDLTAGKSSKKAPLVYKNHSRFERSLRNSIKKMGGFPAITDTLVRRALEGNEKSMGELLERTIGKVPQAVGIDPNANKLKMEIVLQHLVVEKKKK